ncbi:hypothetical protein A2363_05280 [Candidatus Gottesmanbacteria bacterium RIFOXYB1_FULL_47_11]|uniref:Uncharacterized protein n=1 Tax=Candidatus Gottesmanbacteria bacterium RIFOXYB1_FULL_47_11 TaxID=1798401 RepID=A0A1F6BG74_9BACT|nr:MAG: hypothetical protein A2363_05280 [Candidatus Gottesmanbacteria bacterium RIFOXYB1_FULL_47_11]
MHKTPDVKNNGEVDIEYIWCSIISTIVYKQSTVLRPAGNAEIRRFLAISAKPITVSNLVILE